MDLTITLGDTSITLQGHTIIYDRVANALKFFGIVPSAVSAPPLPGTYSQTELDAEVQAAYLRGKADYARESLPGLQQVLAPPTETALLGEVPRSILDGSAYGEYITVPPFPPHTVPAPSEHGYERRAYYIPKDFLKMPPQPVRDVTLLDVHAVEDRSEFVPVILTVLR